MGLPCFLQIPRNQLEATFWLMPPPHGEWGSVWFYSSLELTAGERRADTLKVMTSRFHHSKFVKTGLVFAVCTWGKAEERQGSVKSMTRPACQKPRPCLPSTLTEWVMPRTELAERQEAVTPADSFLDWSVACAILTRTTAFTQSLRLLANQETKVRGCIIRFDADWHRWSWLQLSGGTTRWNF